MSVSDVGGFTESTETTNSRAGVNYGAENVISKANGITEVNEYDILVPFVSNCG